MEKIKHPPIPEELLHEIPAFEQFLSQLGFKRLEGAIFGLLVLAPEGLTSEQIEQTLGLSQGAVSLALKNLIHFNAIEVDTQKDKRKRLYHAKRDSLGIAATIFKKREYSDIAQFKKIAEKLLQLSLELGDGPLNPRVIRLKSIIMTCNLAIAVMNFVIDLVDHNLEHDTPELLNEIAEKLPNTLKVLLEGLGHAKKLKSNIPIITKQIGQVMNEQLERQGKRAEESIEKFFNKWIGQDKDKNKNQSTTLNIQ